MRVGGWGEADVALAELGRLASGRAALEQRRAAVLERLDTEAAGLGRRQSALEAALERFCRRHREEMPRVNGHARRSRRLLFGRVGYRASHGVAVRDEGRALARLAAWRLGRRFVRVRRQLDREALRGYLLQLSRRPQVAQQRLRRAGIELVERENWFYETDPAAVERWG